jgi:hypothetical protein
MQSLQIRDDGITLTPRDISCKIRRAAGPFLHSHTAYGTLSQRLSVFRAGHDPPGRRALESICLKLCTWKQEQHDSSVNLFLNQPGAVDETHILRLVEGASALGKVMMVFDGQNAHVAARLAHLADRDPL